MIRSSVLVSCFLSLVLVVLLPSLLSAQTVNPNSLLSPLALYDFEAPYVSGTYSYNPAITALQQWTWSNGLGGVAGQGSPFDPPGSNTPPHNVQVRATATATVTLLPFMRR